MFRFLDYPEKECPDRIIAKDRIEELLDLPVVPYELSLNCRQVKFLGTDTFHRLFDSPMLIFHIVDLCSMLPPIIPTPLTVLMSWRKSEWWNALTHMLDSLATSA